MDTEITKAINQGIDFLTNNQQKDGSFLSLSSPNSKSFAKAKKYHTIFPAFLVLSCLNALEETPKIKAIKRKAAKFLLSQKNEQWSFNYWVRNSQEAKTLPYPDDLDDTFCALSALFQHDSKLIGGSAMAKIVTLLTAAEKKEGGPYRTWLVPQDADEVWKDIDLVANSNIGYFLSLQDISLPNINTLIESAIETDNYNSPYYPSIYSVIYFISRFYKGKKTKKIRDFLLSKRQANGRWENPLNAALAVLSLLNFGVSPNILKKSIEYLIDQQAKGLWKSYPFCIDPEIERKGYYAGSLAVTTAFCLEAIGKYNQKPKTQVKNAKILIQERIYKQVVKKAKQRFSSLGGELKKQALVVLEATLKKDKDKQIALLPYFFKVSLGKKGKSVSNNLLVKLGVANICGWIAYTIYDDFLDEEGEPKLLSVANICLRESTTIYNNILSKKTGFYFFVQHIADRIDSANTWEVANCRFDPIKLQDYGDFSRLAERSLGHALGPLAILFSLGFKEKSPEVRNLMNFFQHFLTARQLNDDAHDWEKDLKAGQINAVGAQILKRARSQRLEIEDSRLQEIFWNEVVVGICQTILKHVQLARKALEKILIIDNLSLLSKLLIPIEASAQKALKEREETLKFLRAYGKTTF